MCDVACCGLVVVVCCVGVWLLFVVRCLLLHCCVFVCLVCELSFGAYVSSFGVWCYLCVVVCSWLFVIVRLVVFPIRCVLPVACCLLHVVGRVLFVVCQLG